VAAGCGLIIVANKWDLVEKETNTAVEFERTLHAARASLRWVPVIFTSALTGMRVRKVLDLISRSRRSGRRRIPTNRGERGAAQLASARTHRIIAACR
jgi:GTPase